MKRDTLIPLKIFAAVQRSPSDEMLLFSAAVVGFLKYEEESSAAELLERIPRDNLR